MKTFEMPTERLMMLECNQNLSKNNEKNTQYGDNNSSKLIIIGEKVKKLIRKK